MSYLPGPSVEVLDARPPCSTMSRMAGCTRTVQTHQAAEGGRPARTCRHINVPAHLIQPSRAGRYQAAVHVVGHVAAVLQAAAMPAKGCQRAAHQLQRTRRSDEAAVERHAATLVSAQLVGRLQLLPETGGPCDLPVGHRCKRANVTQLAETPPSTAEASVGQAHQLPHCPPPPHCGAGPGAETPARGLHR